LAARLAKPLRRALANGRWPSAQQHTAVLEAPQAFVMAMACEMSRLGVAPAAEPSAE